MLRDFDSTDRTSADYVIFGLAFAGFLLGLMGMVLSVPALAVLGAVIFIFAVGSFRLRSRAES